MKVFASSVDVASAEFGSNYEAMGVLVAELERRLEEGQWQGEERTTRRFAAEGKLLARERIELLLDDDAPYLEICALAGWGQEDSNTGSTAVGGIGFVCGVMVVVMANVGSINGGTVRVPTMQRMGRLSEIAMTNRLPVIRLSESGGADLRVQAEIFHQGGGGFYHQAHLSKAGIPQISVVFGNATAGGAYGPGMSDYSIMVAKRGFMFLGGPPLVKMATGEECGEEELGGAEMHSTVSGVTDFMAVSDVDAIRKARAIVASLNITPHKFVPKAHWLPFDEPRYNTDELLGILSPNLKKPLDMREVLARIVDNSAWTEFKPTYGRSILTCWTRIQGFLIGVIANLDGVIFSESSLKAAQFIHLCNMQNTPILFLHNVSGFMVGSKAERSGIIKAGSQMINAVSNSGVPHLAVIVGASYGAGNYAMSGRSYKPRFLWSFPNSRCAVMGGDQLAGVLDIVSRRSAKSRGVAVNEEQAKASMNAFRQMVDTTADVYYTSSRCIDDGVIDPRETRIVLGLCLEIVHQNEEPKGANTFGISRL